MDTNLVTMMDPAWWTGWRLFWAFILFLAAGAAIKSVLTD
jgi:hypothetical protein